MWQPTPTPVLKCVPAGVLPDDFGTSPIRPAGDNSAPRVRDGASQFVRQFSAHLFASVDGRAVAAISFSMAIPFRDSHSVNKSAGWVMRPVGIAANFGVYKIAFVRVFRSQEFAGQASAPRLRLDHHFRAAVVPLLPQ